MEARDGDSLRRLLRDYIQQRLYTLAAECTSCSQRSVCEEQEGASRYCWPMIEAAILDYSDWESGFMPETD